MRVMSMRVMSYCMRVFNTTIQRTHTKYTAKLTTTWDIVLILNILLNLNACIVE